MSTKQLIEALKSATSTNKCMEAVLIMWAHRERARHQVTVHALYQRMRAEGFTEYNAEEYRKVLGEIGKLGFGKIKYDKSGRVTALVELKTTLQSIGKAATGVESSFEIYNRRNQYGKLANDVIDNASVSDVQKASPAVLSTSVVLTFILDGKPVNVSVPSGFTAEEVGRIVERFQERNAQ